MTDIASTNHAKLILKPGDVYRISSSGVATASPAYGAPAGDIVVTASTRDIGPYDSPAKFTLTATSGTASYRLLEKGSLGTELDPVTGLDVLDAGSRAVFNPSATGCVQTFRALGAAGVSVGAAYTFSNSFTAEGPYDAVRFLYANYGAAAYTISAAKTAASPTLADNGTGLTHAAITFDHSASAQCGDVWDGLTGSTATYSVTGAISGTGADVVPNLVWSDWVPQQSVACTDSGNSDLCVIQHRAYSVSTGYNVSQSGSTTGNWGNYNTNSRRKVFGALTAGDKVTSITAITNATTWQWMMCVGFQAILRKPIYNHGIFGDSISKGQGAFDDNAGLWGWSQRATQGLTDAGIGCHSVVNYACSGQKKAATWATFLQVIQQRGLDTATMFPWSPNDGIAAGSAPWALSNFKFQVNAFVAACRRYGVKPIIATQGPSSTITDGASDLLRIAFNAEIRLLRAQGVSVADFDLVLSNGASPARYITGLTNTDDQHPSAAGHAAMDTEYRRAVRVALMI